MSEHLPGATRASSSGVDQSRFEQTANEPVACTGIAANAVAAVLCRSARVGAGKVSRVTGAVGVAGAEVLSPS
ncbi:hypothetical protein D3C71_2037070 [compost metagenome]